MRPYLRQILAEVDRNLRDSLRQQWRWAVPDRFAVVGITIVGDWIFVDDGGAVFLLETVEGTFEQIANNQDELETLLQSEDARDEIFLEAMALGAIGDGKLPRNHCVGFKVPPVLGGGFEASNLEVVRVERYQVWTARMHV